MEQKIAFYLVFALVCYLKWGKAIKFGFLCRSSDFVCSDENTFRTKCRRILWGKKL